LKFSLGKIPITVKSDL